MADAADSRESEDSAARFTGLDLAPEVADALGAVS